MNDETKLTLLFTDAELILQECRELKANLSLELQAARDDRRAQHREFQEFLAELRETLTKIQTQFRIEAQLLNLISPAGEDGCQKRSRKRSTNQSRMLKQFAKNTH